MKKITIIIADDHEMILKGIRAMLQSYPNIEIIGEFIRGKEAVSKSLQLIPDIVFMDIAMPDISGIDACREIVQENPDIKVIALSHHEDGEYVYRMLKAGCSGYMLKNSSKEEFFTAIQHVMEGEKYFSQRISEIMISDLINRKETEGDSNASHIHITIREREIIRMIADELTNPEISEILHISQRTVETHRRNIMQKLKVKSVVSLLKYAMSHNIISLQRNH